MPKIKSAKKRVETTERNRKRNRTLKSAVRTARIALADDLKTTKGQSAQKSLSEVFSKIDKAVSKGALHKNTAARRKSSLSAAVKKTTTT